MPRQPRIQDEYMIHHVVARGNRKEKVFHSDGDYIRYLQLLERYRDRYNFHLFSYCLMDNHVHLLVQQSTTPFV
jgi:putative transposase